MKIGICADIHAHNYSQYSETTENGLNSRFEWILKALSEIIYQSTKRKLNALVIAGDLFQSRKAIDITVLDSMYKILATCEIPLYILLGNHGISHKGGDKFSINIFRKVATVITTPSEFTIGGSSIGFIPWTENLDVIGDAVRHFQKKKIKYVIGHLAMRGGVVGSHEYIMEGYVEPVAFRKFTWVALGHYHRHQKLKNNIYYVGSPLQHTWGESGDEKGFMIFGSSGKPEFVPLPNFPRFIKVTKSKDAKDVRTIDYVKIVGSESLMSRIKLPRSVKRIEIIEKDEEHHPRIEFDNTSVRSILKTYIENFPQDIVDEEFLLDVGLDYLKG